MTSQEERIIQEMFVNMQLQISAAHCVQCPHNWADAKYNSYNRLYFIIDGAGWIEIEGERLCPQPNQLVLLPGGSWQEHGTVPGEKPYRKYWTHFFAQCPREEISLRDTKQAGRLIKVIKHINNNLTNSISTAELAELIHYHPNYFLASLSATCIVRQPSILDGCA